MKIFAIVLTILMIVSYASAAVAVAPTPVPNLNKRDQFPNAVNIPALLADPKSYLASVSKELKSPGTKYAELWAKATNNPQYHASISSALKDTFGSKTAHLAMAQFTSKIAEASASSSHIIAAVQTPASAVQNAAASVASDNPPVSSAASEVLGALTSGAESRLSSNYFLVFAIVPALLVALL